MVRDVPDAPETQFQPPLVVICIERDDPLTERGDTEHDKVVDVADASDVGP